MAIGYKACAIRPFLSLMAMSFVSQAGSQVTFDTPDDAAKALLTALAMENDRLFLSVAGPQMAEFWNSGDAEKDAWERGRFLDAARTDGIHANSVSDSWKMVFAGRLEDPFPAPLVKTDRGWRFDDGAGSREVTRRRIRRNQTAVIELCLRFREAEYEYRALVNGGGHAFALRIRSTPGQHDGLFWTGGEEDDQSPLGPPFASAAFAERQSNADVRPLFGYYFKVLWGQGQDVPGGAQDYRSHGQLRKGFALVAWPATYGVGGTETLLTNHFGDVYRKDLGPDTARIAESMAVFNPDRTWIRLHDLD